MRKNSKIFSLTLVITTAGFLLMTLILSYAANREESYEATGTEAAHQEGHNVSPDLNGDRIVDMLDISLILNKWQQNVNDTESTDLNGDGVIDILDLSMLLKDWGTTPEIPDPPEPPDEPKTPDNPDSPDDPNPPQSGKLAPVKISSNNHYLLKENGEPFLWIADTAWDLVQRLSKDEVKTYLDNRKAKGFTVVMFTVTLSPNTVKPGDPFVNRESKAPFVNEDVSRINPEFFTHIDYILDELEKREMVAGMLPGWGWVLSGNEINGHSYKNGNEANMIKYATFLGERYKNRGNVVWIVGGDTTINNTWIATAKELKRVDPDALITFHPSRRETSTWHKVKDADWIDFHMTQTGHVWDNQQTYVTVNEVYNKSNKPMLNGESLYEKIYMGYDDPGTPHQVRKAIYWSLFSGSFGYTYGHTAIFQFGRAIANQKDTYCQGPLDKWSDAIDAEGGKQMKYVSDLIRSREWHNYIPNQELITSNNPYGSSHVRATMKSDKTEAMIYFPEKKSVTIDTSLLTDISKKKWYNPQDGTYQNATSNGSSFTPPFGPDSVLVLE